MNQEKYKGNVVTMPRPQNFKTPRLLMTDAYTFGSSEFESKEAMDKSVYYITFRSILNNINPFLYNKGDDRIILAGLSKLVYNLFAEKITMEEIYATDRFIEQAKVTGNGLTKYNYPRKLWLDILCDYNGRPPIEIIGLAPGSICYPNEPCIQITSSSLANEQMGVLAAWFESQLLMVWGPSEFVTQNEHWLLKYKELLFKYDSSLTEDTADFLARISLIDFGARSAMTPQETEWYGEYNLWTFSGSDSFAGCYQAWENNNRVNEGLFNTVNALAHRNVQTFKYEADCYQSLYNAMGDNHIGSFVCDCYSSYDAISNPLLTLALDAKKNDNGKTIIGRVDSGNAIEQIIYLCRLAHKNGLFTTKIIDGREWRFGTNFKAMASNDVTWEGMVEIYEALAEESFMPYSWVLSGMGGKKRNDIARDNLSAKYALCAYGEDDTPACKFSEDLGKGTLPGPHKLLRTNTALVESKTVVFSNEDGIDARVKYYDGSKHNDPFGSILNETVNDIKLRIKQQVATMPLTLVTKKNLKFPISDLLREKRRELVATYAPKKQIFNY